MFRKKLRSGELDDTIIELEVAGHVEPAAGLDIPGSRRGGGMGGGMMNLGDMFGKAFGNRTVRRKMTRRRKLRRAVQEEADKLLDPGDGEPKEALRCGAERHRLPRRDRQGRLPGRTCAAADVSREGVQRDLLPLIEGTTVSTKHGPVKTDHILFIASGAFHIAKPSDLLPELQGRCRSG
jgi:ATP-dependent HslUV protease ATP-binding subunit HslU